VDGLSGEIDNPMYSTAVGLLLYAAGQEHKKSRNKVIQEDKKSSFGRIKDWIKENF